MTIKGGTICSLVQSFPILLILAQNYNRCLKTPLIYKPPTPTPSPEYYEALEALVQNIFGHGHHGGDHSHSLDCAYGVYGKKLSHGKYSTPCHTYGYPTVSHYGHGYGQTYPTTYKGTAVYAGASYPGTVYAGASYPGNVYAAPGATYAGTTLPGTSYYGYSGYPTYGYKKLSANNLAGTDKYKGTYAPTQVYNLNHKYKVVVKKNKKRRPRKLLSKFSN